MPSGASKDSLKEYVKSIAAPGTSTVNMFGLKSWMSSSRGETVAPLLENEDNFQEPTGSAGESSWLGSSTTDFLGLVSGQRILCSVKVYRDYSLVTLTVFYCGPQNVLSHGCFSYLSGAFLWLLL